MDCKYFRLYSNCIMVKGAIRSIITDLHCDRYIFIPNDLYDILFFNQNKLIEEKNLLKHYGKYKLGIKKFISYLIENEFGFYTNKPDLFPKLNLHWDYPSLITNSVIDFDNNSNYNYKEAFFQLNELRCSVIQLRFYNKISKDKIFSIISDAYNIISCVEFIELVLPYDVSLRKVYLLKHFNKITNIYYYSTNKNMQFFDEKNKCIVKYSKMKNIDEQCCGIVDNYSFICNLKFFSEVQKNNSCLNRKISIDKNGEIKNCPAFLKSHGNIKNILLKEVLEKPNFKSYWQINKDKIEVCKDCEFRYICIDCRVFIKDTQNIYSKPSKCSYNPYSAIWE